MRRERKKQAAKISADRHLHQRIAMKKRHHLRSSFSSLTTTPSCVAASASVLINNNSSWIEAIIFLFKAAWWDAPIINNYRHFWCHRHLSYHWTTASLDFTDSNRGLNQASIFARFNSRPMTLQSCWSHSNQLPYTPRIIPIEFSKHHLPLCGNFDSQQGLPTPKPSPKSVYPLFDQRQEVIDQGIFLQTIRRASTLASRCFELNLISCFICKTDSFTFPIYFHNRFATGEIQPDPL